MWRGAVRQRRLAAAAPRLLPRAAT
eukprot:COSAG04_NODE_18992_length_427_cov_1.323171_1_plen_24_part_10